MKSGNYDELMDKFYAGTASAEEINLLQSEKLIDDLDNLYVQALDSEREQKMDWEFDNFMKEIPATKVVALPAHRIWVKRMMSAAAIVAAILTAYVFWPQQNQHKEIAKVPVIQTPIKSNQLAENTEPVAIIKEAQPVAEIVKTAPKANKNYAVNTRKQRPEKSIVHAAKENVDENKNTGDFLVMVNGKAITNEADAVVIMKESLSMFSRNLTSTVDELRPLSQIKIKL